ncbi:hypothetical protein [uncultured Rothia sp.]|mgnify:CR=1 FL=1|uniref:hypothetical protein n=1 Tax=uncultured Rothia sp. TaxID=316088 RepID=UPI00260AF2D6|nr:hypothetical protein [uncultured Rothia sp.]
MKDVLNLLSDILLQHLWRIRELQTKGQNMKQEMLEMKELLELYLVALQCAKLEKEKYADE